ncbi:hypothetical protein VB715_13530 [Crocosphaera sp. UHCC 0190]|uniref:hypothetical protein n=1 Tax=Crocosphaera sp. UHCC 0190 TaxID=3110246 RepID=UPI002B218309|nr:hypothetical protein [Crocosphaera sp. UHCC 0190]MEA5510789.1 hypothetical protein [Crocosphaera sp. UHCC 0190]
MNRFLIGIIPIIALTSAVQITTAQTMNQSQGETTAATQGINGNSPYLVGTVVGVVSGPYGSILFVELADKTKLKFHHPSSSVDRGERVLVYKKNGDFYLIEAANPQY